MDEYPRVPSMKALPQDQIDVVLERHTINPLIPTPSHRPFQSRTGFGPIERDFDTDPHLGRSINNGSQTYYYNEFAKNELRNRYQCAVALNGPDSIVARQLKYHLDNFDAHVQ